MNAAARCLPKVQRGWAQPPSGKLVPRAAALLVAVALITACVSVAPGSDPVVVRAEQALADADALYADGMAYYFQPGVAAAMAPSTRAVFEAIRTGFDPVYKDAQKALDVYKAVKAVAGADASSQQAALTQAVGKLGALINQILSQLPVSAQKKSAGKAVTQ